MTLPRIRSIVSACALLSAALAPGQTRRPSTKELPPSAYKLIEVKVTGTTRYRPEDVLPATGLQLGQTVHEEDFKDAARHLGDSGAFTDITYTFQYSPDGTKLEFQLQDAAQFVPVRFENVVWFSDQDLQEKLHAQVSLFRGRLPITGQLLDQVSEALQALLIEKKVPGNVDYIRVAHQDGPIEAFAYTVTGPQIMIRNIEFTGAGAAELPPLETAAKKLQGSEYVRSLVRVQEDKNFLPIYLARGYLRASFAGPEAKVVQESEDETLVDVTVPVNPGAQYKMAGLELVGYKVFPADTLRHLVQLDMNQPVNAVRLDQDIQVMKQLYGTRGYATASITPEAQIDDAQSTVKYKININEGDQYKMGDLEIHGLDSPTTVKLQNNWTMRSGDIYDSGYPRRFADQAYKELSSMGDWRIAIHETVNQKDKTVDVLIRFDLK